MLRMEIWESPDPKGHDRFGLISGLILREGDIIALRTFRVSPLVHQRSPESVQENICWSNRPAPEEKKAFCTLKHELRAVIHMTLQTKILLMELLASKGTTGFIRKQSDNVACMCLFQPQLSKQMQKTTNNLNKKSNCLMKSYYSITQRHENLKDEKRSQYNHQGWRTVVGDAIPVGALDGQSLTACRGIWEKAESICA